MRAIGYKAASCAVALVLVIVTACLAAALAQDPMDEPRLSTTVPLSSIHGCGPRHFLQPGLDCLIDSTFTAHQTHKYTFEAPKVAQGGRFSVLATMTVYGGSVSMSASTGKDMFQSVFLNGEDVSNPRQWLIQPQFIRISPQKLTHGQWSIQVSSRTPSNYGPITYTLRIQTLPESTRLAAIEKAALSAITSDCCNLEKVLDAGGDLSICAVILPNAIKEETTATTDLCQLGAFSCNSEGRLMDMRMGTAAFSCTSLPVKLDVFSKLRSLHLGSASFGESTFVDAAKVLAPMSHLEELFLPQTTLGGPLPCSLVQGKRRLARIIIDDTRASGQLPDCFLASTSLELLQASRTGLSGGLPDVIPRGSRLRVLVAAGGSGIGGESRGAFSGPLPQSLVNAVNLTTLTLSHHNLTGALPKLPESVARLQLEGNRITRITALPAGLRVVDLSNNMLSGPLPDLKDGPALSVVNLSANRISRLPPTFGRASLSLVALDVASNAIQGELHATDWGAMTSLETIELSNNNISGTLPASLASLPNLYVLNLGHNRITSSLDAFANALPLAPAVAKSPASASAPSGTAVGVEGHESTNGKKPDVGSKLAALVISHNLLTGSIPTSLSRLGVFHYVPHWSEDLGVFHTLDLSHNQLWTELPAFTLTAISKPLDSNPCGCYLWIDLSNNTRFCPTAEAVASLSKSTIQALTAPDGINITCLTGDFTKTKVSDYLTAVASGNQGVLLKSIPSQPTPPSQDPLATSSHAWGPTTRRLQPPR